MFEFNNIVVKYPGRPKRRAIVGIRPVFDFKRPPFETCVRRADGHVEPIGEFRTFEEAQACACAFAQEHGAEIAPSAMEGGL